MIMRSCCSRFQACIRPFCGLFDFDSRACGQRTFPEDVEEATVFYDHHQVDRVAFFRSERIRDFFAGIFNYVSPPLATLWQAYRRMK
jgi:hypothetical protein